MDCELSAMHKTLNRLWLILFFVVFEAAAGWGAAAMALSPHEVLVVANQNVRQSISLARFYMEQRKIPKKNLLVLFLTDKETCSQEEYQTKAVPMVRKALDQNQDIRVLVSMFGVPLRIADPGKLPAEQTRLREYEQQKNALEDELAAQRDTADIRRKLSEIQRTMTAFLRGIDRVAAFDSELAMVRIKDYDLNLWQPNPYYLGFHNQNVPFSRSDILMTSRLDGPDPGTVKRMILDAIAAEKNGLKGSACFDARWPEPEKTDLSGYAFYDKSIYNAARILRTENRLPVVINDAPTLFQEGEGLEAALYCGWYSLGKYIDAFVWQKGSVGYHIASSECTTLKNKNSQVWCKKMLEKGVAATIGPVGEPYVQAFPVPELFFNFLTEGYLTLVESYMVSLPFLSWKMVLVGDPLYRLNLKP